ncbi:MAG: hypothetical protein ACI4IL_01815 [Eubacterium sp.]
MKKVFKIVSVVIALTLLIDVCSYFGVFTPIVRTQAVLYLCQKYDAKPSDFKLIDQRKKQIDFFSDSGNVWGSVELLNCAFEFEYNGREFFVNTENHRFSDDYQLEDLEEWCVEWLQDNIDAEIVEIQMDTDILKGFYEYNGLKMSKPLSKDDAKNYLDYNLVTLKEEGNSIYFYSEGLKKAYEKKRNDEAVRKKADSIEMKLEKEFGKSSYAYGVNFSIGNKIKKYKSGGCWSRVISNRR